VTDARWLMLSDFLSPRNHNPDGFWLLVATLTFLLCWASERAHA
jgi:hypothetical protein